MLGAFVDLTFWSVRNRLRARLRRLREPRYLVGSIVGVRLASASPCSAPCSGGRAPDGSTSPRRSRMLTTPRGHRRGSGSRSRSSPLALLIGLVAGRGAVRSSSRPPRCSSCFPRRSPGGSSCTTSCCGRRGDCCSAPLIATLLLRPGTLRDGWMFSVGFWLGLTVCRLYAIGVGLAGGLRRRWRAGRTRRSARSPSSGCAAAPAAAAAIAGGARCDGRAASRSCGESGRRARPGSCCGRSSRWRACRSRALAAAFSSAFPGALLLVAVTYARVMRADAAFEEASAAHAERARGGAGRGPTGEAVAESRGAVPARARGEARDGDPLEEPDPARALRLAVDAAPDPPLGARALAVGARGGKSRGPSLVSICP